MTGVYLIDCSCGRTVAVRAQQAGSRVPCDCGQTVEVPRLRELRKCRTDTLAATARPHTVKWDLGQGVSFSLGMLMALIALGCLIYLVIQDRGLSVDAPQLSDLVFAEDPNEWSAPVAFERWLEIRDVRLGNREDPYFLAHRRFRRQLRTAMVVAGVFLFVGTGAACWPLVGRRRGMGSR